MTQAMKCQHDGEKITGWDEVTCRKCGWIVPSGQSIGIHFGWFPSHEAHKEFKKYRTYTGMDNTYPIDATKYDEVQNMTQTNNDREVIELNDIALKQQSEAWLAVFHVLNEVKPNWLDSNLPAMGCAVNAIKELAKSPTSQNEQQPKQIPEGWHVVSNGIDGDIAMTSLVAGQLICIRDALSKDDINEAYDLLYGIADPNYTSTEPWNRLEEIAMLNAAPTNTEVGE